jgi:hypothetical protein
LNTQVPGSFTFTVTAVDHAGLRSTSTVKYVVKAMPAVEWQSPAGITYGTALNVSQLNATSTVPGTFAYQPSAGTVLSAGTHTLNMTFTPIDVGTYFTVSVTTVIVVAPAPLTIIANDAAKVYGQALPSFTATATELVNGDTLASLAGALSFTTGATAFSSPGIYPITVSGVSSPNYDIRFAAGALTVGQAATEVALTTQPNPSRPRQELQLRAHVSIVAPGSGTATGVVEFRENGATIGSVALTDGIAMLNYRFRRGTYTITAIYSGDANVGGSATATTISIK